MRLYLKRLQPNWTKYQYTNVLPEYTTGSPWPHAVLKPLLRMAAARHLPHLRDSPEYQQIHSRKEVQVMLILKRILKIIKNLNVTEPLEGVKSSLSA